MKKSEYPDFVIPLSIAKELKNIGFKCRTCFYYSFEDLALFVISKPENSNKKCYEGKYISIPTWEQAFSWFRNKGFIATIEYGSFYSEDNSYSFAYRITDISNEIMFYSPNYKKYETFESARKECLKSLINIYKNRQNG